MKRVFSWIRRQPRMSKKELRSLAWRWALVSVITGILSLLSWQHLHLEQDVVDSIEKSKPREAAIFNKLQGSGMFQNRIFLRLTAPDPALSAALDSQLAAAGYALTEQFKPPEHAARSLYQLLPFLPESTQQKLLSSEHRDHVLAQVQTWLTLPGGMGFIKLLAEDPLMLSQELPLLLAAPTAKHDGDGPPLVAVRTAPMDYEKTRALYSFLRLHDKELAFASGDFFALENYDVVQSDMAICSFLSVALSLIVFRLLCRQWILLAFLLFGTWVSSVAGLLAAEWIDGTIYGLVLALTGTFLSFNNETLVHLAGFERGTAKTKESLTAIFSALGTTVIGFLVLLFSSSHMARQMAIICLGSMVGFLVFLSLFTDSVRQLKFRSVSLPQWAWNRYVLGASFLAVAALIALLPKPSYETDLNAFRYASPYLEAETKVFSDSYSGLALEDLQAVPLAANEDPATIYQRLVAEQKTAPGMFHPLSWYRGEKEQENSLVTLRPELAASLTAVEKALHEVGLNLQFDPSLGELAPRSSRAYLELWSQILPLPWYVAGSDSAHFLAFIKHGTALAGAIPLHPKAFYEFILTDLTVNIGILFLIGLAAMLVYLIPWQRDWAKVALIFLPLLLSTLVLQILFIATGRSLTIVHMMGLTLVIGVALDYSAILVSTDHDPVDQGKVVLTGGLTLTSFGSLLFATHPVLRELALVVVIGTVVAFLMALFTRMPVAKGLKGGH